MYYSRRQIKHDYDYDYRSIDDMNKESDVEEISCDNDSDNDDDCKYEITKNNVETKTESNENRILNIYKKYINIDFNEEGVFTILFIIGFILLSFNLLFT